MRTCVPQHHRHKRSPAPPAGRVCTEPSQQRKNLQRTRAAPAVEAPFNPRVCVVLGTQWGDEGKGKLVDILAQKYDLVARAQVSSRMPPLFHQPILAMQCWYNELVHALAILSCEPSDSDACRWSLLLELNTLTHISFTPDSNSESGSEAVHMLALSEQILSPLPAGRSKCRAHGVR